MSTITCARCKRETAAMPKSPLPGAVGEELLANTCDACFKDWMGTEIMIINEYRLDLGVPRNQELLDQEMARFLALPSAGGAAPTGAPPQATPMGGHGHGHAHGDDEGHGGSCC